MTSVLVFSTASGFSGCGKKKKSSKDYKVRSEEFFFSTDNGKHYGNGRVEFPVGDSVYMKVVVYIESKDGDGHDVEGQLSIPNIEAVDSYYLKGQKITPEVDDINELTTYPFEITTDEEWVFLFEFVPNEVGKLTMDLSFDDSIDEKYDMTNTIKIVEEVDDEDDDEDEDEDDDEDEDEDEEEVEETKKKSKKKKNKDEDDD